MDKSVSALLREKAFRFNKQFGQNFITDTNLLDAMAIESGAQDSDTVLEIGAGAGTLTIALSKIAKKVVAFEIDNNLKVILAETLEGISNITTVFCDFMKVSDSEIEQLVGRDYRVVANLPYYITTPIIMRLLESENPPKSISVMVQKEVAQRITAKADSAEYGAITAAIDLVANSKITRIVRKDMFYPVPQVDSAVLRIDYVENKYPSADIDKTKKIIKASFSMRRKTLINNLTQTYGAEREQVIKALAAMGLDERVRGETLSTAQFVKLAEILTI